MVIRMNNKIEEKNVNILWNYSKFEYTIDKKGKLIPISRWNLIGKLIKMILDRNGELTKRIHEAVRQTLEFIQKSNEDHKLVYVRNQGKDFLSIFHDVERFYSSHYPSYLLAQKVKKQFENVTSVSGAADRIIEQKSLYPKDNSVGFDPCQFYGSKRDRRILNFQEYGFTYSSNENNISYRVDGKKNEGLGFFFFPGKS